MITKRLSTRTFWSTVTKQVRRKDQPLDWPLTDRKERGSGFQRWIADLILTAEPGFDSKAEHTTIVAENLGVDLIFEDSARNHLLIVLTKYQPRGRAIVESQVADFFDRHEKFMNRDWLASRSSGTTPQALLDYGEKVENGYSVSYYFVSTGEASSRLFDLARASSASYADQGLAITCEVFDFGRLKRYYERSLLLSAGSNSSVAAKESRRTLALNIISEMRTRAVHIYQRCLYGLRSWNIRQYLAADRDLRLVLLITLVAVIAILATSIVQIVGNARQLRIERYEVALVEMRKGYVDLMEAFADMDSSFETSSLRDFSKKTHNLESRYFAVEPFLDQKTRTELWEVLQSYIEGSRQSKIGWEYAAQKRNAQRDAMTRSYEEHEGIFLSHRKRIREVFLKAMSEAR